MALQKKTIETIDKFILGLIILFIISLTNSIFANQIGYFFAFFLLIIRFALTRENKFEKNGLELAFGLFLAAELLSALFSINHAQAFQNFFKRLVLIPVVYTIAASVNDTRRAKLYFKIYLGAALITMIIYIIIAYEHFVAQLYSIESKGPSPFQYVMTAGGLMSITTVFLFALLINEKSKIAVRLLYLAAFIISSVGLFSSYTRAAWLGAAAGILTAIILKRRWVLLVPVAILVIFAVFYFKNESKIIHYTINGDKFVLRESFSTGGRASKVITEGGSLLVADHQEGVAVYERGKLARKIETPSPAVILNHWKDNFYMAYLIDSRIVLMQKAGEGEIKKISEFYTPGHTYDLKVRNNNLYVADIDSGLTIFKDPLKISVKIHYPELDGIANFDCDSTWFVSFSPIKNTIKLYSLKDGFRLAAADSAVNKSPMGFIWLDSGRVFFQSEDEFIQYKISEGRLRKVNSRNLKGIFRMEFEKDRIFACTVNGKVYASENGSSRPLHFTEFMTLGFSPTDFIKDGNEFYFSYYKRNRLTSILDPYHESNIERLDQWRTGLKIFADHPLFGVGDIDLNKVYSEYKDPFLKENFGHLHNNYMQFIVILGCVGFVMVIFLLIRIHLLNIKIYTAVKNIPIVSSFSLGAASAFVGFLFSGLGEWNFGDQEIITMIWFTLGLNIAFYKAHLKSIKDGVKTDE
jgi:hypothetical protein